MSLTVSVRIDDVCPLIQYSGSWRTGSQVNDPYHDSYSDGGTFTVTQSNAAFATISFNGTGITVYGARRGNHNIYSMSLDGDVRTTNGQSTSGETFGQTLFDSPSLTNGPHTLIIRDASTNADPDQSYFDIDYVVIATEVEGAKSVQLEDTDDAFSYGPSGATWNTNPQQVSAFSGANGHSTSSAQATSTLRFTGSAVDIFGLVCATCGQYGVSVDNGTPVTLSAFNSYWTKPKTLLYMARGLNDGPHTLTLSNLPGGNGTTLNIDYAVVYGSDPAGDPHGGNDNTSGPGDTSGSGGNNNNDPSSGAAATTSGTSSSSPQSQDGDDKSSNGVPVGAVVGAVLGGLAFAILSLALVIYLVKRRKIRRQHHLNPLSPVAQPVSQFSIQPFQIAPASQSMGIGAGFAGNIQQSYPQRPFESTVVSSSSGATPPDYASATGTGPHPVYSRKS